MARQMEARHFTGLDSRFGGGYDDSMASRYAVVVALLGIFSFACAPLPGQEVCTTCVPNVSVWQAPPANITLSFIEGDHTSGECHGPLVACNPAQECSFVWWMGVTVTNPSPPDPMPRVKITIGTTTIELDWALLTGTHGVATLESTTGELACGSQVDGDLHWLEQFIAEISVTCSACLRATG